MTELKAFEVTRKALFGRTCTEKVYLKSETDKVIQRLDNAVDVYKSSLKISKGLEAELSAKLCESKKTCKAVRRALWLARAERAADRARIFYFNDLKTILDIDGYSYDSKKKKGHKKLTARLWRIIWEKVERKCRAMADKF